MKPDRRPRLDAHVRIALAFAVCMASPAVHAGRGAYEISQDCATNGCFSGDTPGFPVAITKPGKYVLTSDLHPPSNGTAVYVSASPVDLNLNGHTIDGGGSCSGSPVTGCTTSGALAGIGTSNADPPGVLHIHDGTIRGFTNSSTGGPSAIYLGNAGDGTVLEHLNVLENGDSGNEAISVFGDAAGSILVRDSQISRNRHNGVGCRSGNQASLLVENSEFRANGGDGVQVSFCANASLTGSRFNGNALYAIYGISAAVAIGADSFGGNNGGGANAQYSVTTVVDAGANVCIDHMPCP